MSSQSTSLFQAAKKLNQLRFCCVHSAAKPRLIVTDRQMAAMRRPAGPSLQNVQTSGKASGFPSDEPQYITRGSASTGKAQLAIEFRHVSLSFDEVAALRDITFELRRGQMIIITGDSSSGKSVLLKLAMGLIRPDEGQILINGREIQRLGEDKLLAIRRDSMGLMFQEDALFSGMSTYDNTAYRLVEHGWSEEDTDRAVREILQFVGLEDDLEKLPEELSGGMKRRLEFARAVVGWPSILLFDEPTAGLDPINAKQVLDLIISARDLRKISSLCVTKALREIPYLAFHRAALDETGRAKIATTDWQHRPDGKVMLLQRGEIAFFGEPEEFQTSVLPAVIHMTHPEREARSQ